MSLNFYFQKKKNLTHVHQKSQSDVVPHTTLLSGYGCQVREPGQRHPVLVEIRVKRLEEFQLVCRHESCTEVTQFDTTWMDGRDIYDPGS